MPEDISFVIFPGAKGDPKKFPLFLPLCILSTLTLIIYRVGKSKWNNERTQWFQKFPGPKPLPLIGNGIDMIFKPTEFYKWSWDLCRKWGDAVLLWRLRLPMLFISSYETAIDLLSQSNFNAKSHDIGLFWRLPGGNGLSSSPAELHHSRRKLLSPGYTRQIVAGSMYIFSEESRLLVNKLGPYADTGKSFEILEFLMPCSFRTTCRSAFGDHLMAQRSDQEAMDHMHALHEISQNFTRRLFSPFLWLRNDFIYFNLTPEGRRTKRLVKAINEFGMKAISLRNQTRTSNSPITCIPEKDSDFNDNINDCEKSICYLDMLLDFGDKGYLKKIEILGELNNYIVAGYDATALAIAWTLFALALNSKHHQDKIHEEVEAVFEGAHDEILSYSDTKKLKYLELVIKEAFRLFPTSPVLPRSTTENMLLRDGRVVPSGTDVFIMVDRIHRDPRYFPEPDKFIPERHLHPNPAFFPFSTGVRNCIGQVYAMHQLKTELAYLLKEFIWETDEDEETLPRLFQALMVPVNGIRMKIRRR